MQLDCACKHCPNATCMISKNNGVCLFEYTGFEVQTQCYVINSFRTNNTLNLINLGCISNIKHMIYRKCCIQSMCNTDYGVTMQEAEKWFAKHMPPHQESESMPWIFIVIWLCIILICTLITVVIICITMSIYKTRKTDKSREDSESEDLMYTGSGSGRATLFQRRICKWVKPISRLYAGRYGEVWRGVYRNKVDVAIKYLQDVDSWSNEIEIYQLPMISHNNILGFISADQLISNYIILLEYCGRGSLYEVLEANEINNVDLMISYMADITAGLMHLHMAIYGEKEKPQIAHRDIKSKNILMKDNGTLCIGDLGMAICLKSLVKNDNIATKGTVRYLAPELLEPPRHSQMQTINWFIGLDIYSLSLVFWEIFNRTTLNGQHNKYEQPYDGYLSTNPSIEEIREVIIIKKIRPSFKNEQSKLVNLVNLLNEMWTHENEERLPTFRIEKRIRFIQEEIKIKEKY